MRPTVPQPAQAPHWAEDHIRRRAGSPQAYARGLMPWRETVVTIGRMGRWVLLAMTLVVVVSVALLRRRPLPALVLLLAGSAAAKVAAPDSGQIAALLPFLLVLPAGIEVCFIAATRPRRTSIAAAVVALGVLAGYAAEPTPPRLNLTPVALLLAIAMATIIAWLIGHSIRQAHVHSEALRAQAQAQAAMAERLRIARELHDMVAHSIGIIAIQAGMGSRVIATQPAETRNALDAIETTSRQTLAGLRQMLGALRRAEPGTESGPPPLDPAPGLADLGRLAATTLDAGVRVDVQWRGDRRPLPAEVDLAGFRIVQEAVTPSRPRDGDPRAQRWRDAGCRQANEMAGSGESGYGKPHCPERPSFVEAAAAAVPGDKALDAQVKERSRASLPSASRTRPIAPDRCHHALTVSG
jgi:signal transduction histidine kinase